LNASLREEYARATSVASSLAEQCQDKDVQLKKLQLAVSRLEGLCRCLQEKVRARDSPDPSGSTQTCEINKTDMHSNEEQGSEGEDVHAAAPQALSAQSDEKLQVIASEG
jgi:hypothetical protein